jgi:hypothetical protein
MVGQLIWWLVEGLVFVNGMKSILKVVEAEEEVQDTNRQSIEKQQKNKLEKIRKERQQLILQSHEIRQSQENVSTNVVSRPPIPMVFAKQSKTKNNREKAIGWTREEGKVVEDEKNLEFPKRKESFENLEKIKLEPHKHIELQDNFALEEVLLKQSGITMKAELPKEGKETSNLKNLIALQSISVGTAIQFEESSNIQNRQTSNNSMKVKNVLPKEKTSRSVSVVSTDEDLGHFEVSELGEKEAKLLRHTIQNKHRGRSIDRQEGLHIYEDKGLIITEKTDREKRNKADIKIEDYCALIASEQSDISKATHLDKSNFYNKQTALTKTHVNTPKESASKNSTIQGEDESAASFVESIKADQIRERSGELSLFSKEAPTVFAINTVEGLELLESSTITEKSAVNSETLQESGKRNAKMESKAMGESKSQESVSELEDLEIKSFQANLRNERDNNIQQINNVGIMVGYNPNTEDLVLEASHEIKASNVIVSNTEENEVCRVSEPLLFETAPKRKSSHTLKDVHAEKNIVPQDAYIKNVASKTLEHEKPLAIELTEIQPIVMRSTDSQTLRKPQSNTNLQGFNTRDLDTDEIKSTTSNSKLLANMDVQLREIPITIEKVVDMEFLDFFKKEIHKAVKSDIHQETSGKDKVNCNAITSGITDVNEEAKEIEVDVNQETKSEPNICKLESLSELSAVPEQSVTSVDTREFDSCQLDNIKLVPNLPSEGTSEVIFQSEESLRSENENTNKQANVNVEYDKQSVIVEHGLVGESTEQLKKDSMTSKVGKLGREKSINNIVESTSLQVGIDGNTEKIQALDLVENKSLSTLVSNVKRTKHSPVRSPVSKMVIIFFLF